MHPSSRFSYFPSLIKLITVTTNIVILKQADTSFKRLSRWKEERSVLTLASLPQSHSTPYFFFILLASNYHRPHSLPPSLQTSDTSSRLTRPIYICPALISLTTAPFVAGHLTISTLSQTRGGNRSESPTSLTGCKVDLHKFTCRVATHFQRDR